MAEQPNIETNEKIESKTTYDPKYDSVTHIINEDRFLFNGVLHVHTRTGGLERKGRYEVDITELPEDAQTIVNMELGFANIELSEGQSLIITRSGATFFEGQIVKK